MKRLLPLLIILGALGGGLALGKVLYKDPVCDAEHPCDEAEGEEPAHGDDHASGAVAFVELKRQFVIPVLRGHEVQALVVASLAIEVDEGSAEAVYDVEPKLRDAFLQVLFTHAHSGGFDVSFTSRTAMMDLKERLREAAEPVLGKTYRDVLITEIVRQDL